ncbi:diacylglycerol kinase [Desulfotalea psychrophila]|nr:diacylglycerol kinase [Desulfotalea psychrophila]
MKGNRGFKRLVLATCYSYRGLCQAFRHEAAFRQELFLVAILLPLTYWFEVEPIERLLMGASLILVLIVELLNSGIEAVVDRISEDFHELSGRAKDIGSAAVFMTFLLAGYVWVSTLWPLLPLL